MWTFGSQSRVWFGAKRMELAPTGSQLRTWAARVGETKRGEERAIAMMRESSAGFGWKEAEGCCQGLKPRRSVLCCVYSIQYSIQYTVVYSSVQWQCDPVEDRTSPPPRLQMRSPGGWEPSPRPSLPVTAFIQPTLHPLSQHCALQLYLYTTLRYCQAVYSTVAIFVLPLFYRDSAISIILFLICLSAFFKLGYYHYN